MAKLSGHEMAGHPLVRLIDAAFELVDGSEEQRAAWERVHGWLDERCGDPVELLLQLATDRSLLRETVLANGEVPIVATYMLEGYEDSRAVDPLLGLVCSMPHSLPALLQWDAIWQVLHALADMVAAPTIERYRRSDEPGHRAMLATLLGDIRAEGEEVYEILAAELPRRPCLMSAYLGALGDRRALPLLLAMFDDVSWSNHGEFGEPFAGQVMLELCDGIAALSGELSSRQWQSYEQAWRLRAPRLPPPSIVPPPRREKAPPHVAREQAVPLSACTATEFHQKALTWYGTLRNTAAKIGVTPAAVHHNTCTMTLVA